MEFKSLRNIESSFRQIRLFTIVFVALCAAVTGYALWNSYSFAEAQRQKIYVLDGGKSLMLALSQDLSQNRPVEAREHVKRFHELFFTLSPDKSAIESNINRAFFAALVAASAWSVYTISCSYPSSTNESSCCFSRLEDSSSSHLPYAISFDRLNTIILS